MPDTYRNQRAEAASADVRSAETLVGCCDRARAEVYADTPARGPTALQDIRGLVGSITERAGLLRSRIGGVADRTFGEVPALNEKQATDGGPSYGGPSYGGDMAELYYAVQQLSSVVDDANRLFNRMENVA